MARENIHWSELTRNPISDEAQSHVIGLLNSRYLGPIFDLGMFWERELRAKTLLDVGVVEHALEFTRRDGWKHGIFAKLASRVVGVDILADEVERLKAQGFDIRKCDATSDADLCERFDAVYVGDVIEHVNDPVRLLKFGARHLAPGGRMIVTTPCPFWWRNIRLMISDHTFIGNVDHIRWVTPVNALELAHRAEISLDGYFTVETHGNSLPRKLLLSAINGILGRNELFTWAYLYVFSARTNC